MKYEIITGDCLESLKRLPDNSVHCCVTSPPYWGLRDYGTATWEGGQSDCDHKVRVDPKIESSTLGGGKNTIGHQQEGFKNICPRCGAIRKDNQLGLEESPDLYVAKMVEVFREVRRVLREDGTCWLNLGDSYNGSGAKSVQINSPKQMTSRGATSQRGTSVDYLKPKDLVGIPWLVAFALRADGWYLRQDIIWAKSNPMPESVRDRCTKSHEYIFMLTKSARYFYDAEAVKEPAQNWGTRDRTNMRGGTNDPKLKHYGLAGKRNEPDPKRNKRSVWWITPKPFRGAHFATFPPDLVEPCVRAGTSEKGCCVSCGTPWKRILEKIKGTPESFNGSTFTSGKTLAAQEPLASVGTGERTIETRTVGWSPNCKCPTTETKPCVVLDPFCGSGTTGVVALKHGRDFIGLELNPAYAEMADKRISSSLPEVISAAEDWLVELGN